MRPRYGILNKVNDIPLNFKFLLVYIVCLLIPIVFINAVFLGRLFQTIREREEKNYQISMERTKSDINAMIEGCIAVSHSISTDRTLYDLLDKRYQSSAEYYETYDSLLRNKLNIYTAAYNYISSIGVYVDNPTIESGGTYYFIDDAVKDTHWYREMAASRERVHIISYFDRTKSLPNRTIQYFSIMTNYREYQMRSGAEKILKVDLDMERLEGVLNREKDYLTLYLSDPYNEVVCSNDARYAPGADSSLKRLFTGNLDSNSIVIENTLGTAIYLKGWRIVGKANTERLSRSTMDTVAFVLTLALASLFISTILIFIIVRSYNYRLKKLSRHMLKFRDGQFDLIDIVEGKDEIGGVISNFNRMASKINLLINDVYKLELQKKDLELERVRAELNFLQSQMNPHFLFNTLNALLVVCIKNNYTGAIDILKYLSRSLRRLLGWKDDLVEIEEELSFTEMYLKIEKFRFLDKFEYGIDMDPALVHYKIPKMSLQPLVENACMHGIQAIKGLGRVQIKISADGDRLCVSVNDNGTGIDAFKLGEIIGNLARNENSTTSIGIRNVYRRLKLYYGGEVLFDIKSAVNEGTCVCFTIPFNKLQAG